MARKAIGRTALAEAIEMHSGEVLHGYFRKTREVDTTHGAQLIYEYELIDPIDQYKAGKRVALWGCVVLDDLMQGAVLNAEVWIQYLGVTGRTKVYKVEQDPDHITQPKPAEPGDRLPEDIPF